MKTNTFDLQSLQFSRRQALLILVLYMDFLSSTPFYHLSMQCEKKPENIVLHIFLCSKFRQQQHQHCMHSLVVFSLCEYISAYYDLNALSHSASQTCVHFCTIHKSLGQDLLHSSNLICFLLLSLLLWLRIFGFFPLYNHYMQNSLYALCDMQRVAAKCM